MAVWSLRLAAMLVLIYATWNPEGTSYVHWVTQGDRSITAAKAFLGVVLTIGWVAAFVTSWKALGVVPTGLLGALVGTGLWLVIDWTGASLSGRAISHLVLVSIAGVLSTAMSWPSLRDGLSRRGGDGAARDG